MTEQEYNTTRRLPERQRATTNGKRSIDAFLKSCRERTAVEHPEYIKRFDTEINVQLMIAYFYFTKYICARFNTGSWSIFCASFDPKGEGIYTDNLLEDKEYMPYVKKVRANAIKFFSSMVMEESEQI